MPLTFGTFVASTLAIIGFPFTSGFFSKDEILAHALVNTTVNPYAEQLTKRHIDVWQAPSWVGWVLWGMGVLAATLTAFYMCRAVFMTFFGEFRGWTIGRPSQLFKSGHDDDAHDDDDGDHHHEEDLSAPGLPPHESPRAITIPLLILATAAIVAGLFNPGMIKMFSEHFDFLPMDHWLEPVFEEASKGVTLPEAHTMHSREWISTVGAFSAFALGTYVAYWMYIVKKGKLELSYMSNVTKLAAGFSGAVLVVLGGVILALNGKDAFTLKMLVPWAIVAGGVALSVHTVKERAVGLDYVYDRSVVVGVDALADTAASVDQGLVDFVIARLTALIVAALGTLLRVVQNGVVHVYAMMMVLGTVVLGWFFVVPHADATVVESANGDYVVTAAPGTGYGYRWFPDAKGEPQLKAFTGTDSLKVHLEEGMSRTVKVEVRNSFSAGLDILLVRTLFPPVATKEVTLTRPKVEKPTKLELGER
jgi:NADH-quinone oxidoreductase subunit L